MPYVVSPALTKTGNAIDMYVPILGDTAVLPAGVVNIDTAPPSTPEANVVVHVKPPMSFDYAPLTGSQTPFAIRSNGPVSIISPTGPSGRDALSVVGKSLFQDVESTTEIMSQSGQFQTLLANTSLTSVGITNILGTLKLPGTQPDANYPNSFYYTAPASASNSIATCYSFVIGDIRIAFGQTYDRNASGTANGYILPFASIPANTFPNQALTGLFRAGEPISCMASLANPTNVSQSGVVNFVNVVDGGGSAGYGNATIGVNGAYADEFCTYIAFGRNKTA
jgi:hypothetical protein